VHRLDLAETTAILRERSGTEPPAAVARAFYQETEGNPFFTEEVYRHLVESDGLFETDGRWRTDLVLDDGHIPPSVQLAIGRRLERLSSECRRLLTTAAVAGRRFQFDIVASALGSDPDDLLDPLDEAVAASLVRPASAARQARYEFVHELIRQALLVDLSLPRRRSTHRQVAEAIEGLGGQSEEFIAELAEHFYQSGEHDKARYYTHAARLHANSSYAWEDGCTLWRRELEILEASNSEPLEVGRHIAEVVPYAMTSVMPFDEVAAAAERALGIFERTGTRLELARARTLLASVLVWGDPPSHLDFPRARREFRLAIDEFIELGHEREALELVDGIVIEAWQRLDDDAVEAARDEEQQLGRRLGVPVRPESLHGLLRDGQAGHVGDFYDGLQTYWQFAIDQDDSSLGGRLGATRNAEYIGSTYGNHIVLWPHETSRWAQREIGLGWHDLSEVASIELGAAAAARLRGETVDLEGLDLDVAHGEFVRSRDQHRRTHAAQLASLAGQWDRAEGLLRVFFDDYQTAGYQLAMAFPAIGLLRLARVRGDVAAAERALPDAELLFPPVACRSEMALIYIAAGMWTEARDAARICRDGMFEGEEWYGREGEVILAESLMATADGDPGGPAQFDAALAIYQQFKLPWQEADAHLLRGRVLLGLADRSSAQREFEAARSVYERIEAAQPWLDRLDRLADTPLALSAEGPTPTAQPDGLTSRELEVLVEIAAGLTNAAIGEALVIAPGTVARHISNILKKTQLSNRTELARYAAENGLSDAPRQAVGL